MRHPQRAQLVRSFFRAVTLIAVVVGLGQGASALGQSVFWNPPGGGAGTWDITTVNWGTTQATPDYVWTNNGNETANFGVAGGTVALGAPITAFGINFTVSGYAINGTATNTLTLSGPGGIVNTGGNDATFGSILGAASVGFTKAGGGTLTVTASSNLMNFPIGVTGGVLSIDSSLRLNGSGDVTLDGGTLRQTNPNNAGSFIVATRNLVIGTNGGTVDYTSSGAGLVSTYGGASGTILGTGTLTKVGPGEFRYQGVGLPNTTFTKLVVNQGIFRLGFANATEDERGFGAVPAAPLADAITLNGGSIGTSFSAANSVLHPNRGVTLGPNGGFFTNQPLRIPGVITGSGPLNKDTTNTLTLGGAGSVSQNTNTGLTNITAGTVALASADKMSPNSAVVMGSTAGTLNLANFNQTIASLAGGGPGATAGNVSLGSATLTTGGNNSSTTYAGIISGATGSLVKAGTGTMILTGANTYGGTTTVSGGTLLVNGSIGAGAVNVNVGASIGGTGTIGGAVTVDGTVAPGVSPGILGVSSLTLSATGLYSAEIQGTTAGTGYDQINVTGAGGANLGGSTLNLAFSGFTPTTTDVMTIVNNAGGGPLTGVFGNFPTDGQIVATNVLGSGVSYQIFYGTFAGQPGSVVIAAVPEPAHVLLIGAAGAGVVRWYRRRKAVKAAS